MQHPHTLTLCPPAADPSAAPEVLHSATTSGVLACLMRHFRASLASLPLLGQPLSALPIGSWSPHSRLGAEAAAVQTPLAGAGRRRAKAFTTEAGSARHQIMRP